MVTFIILPCKGENAHGRLLSDEKNVMTPGNTHRKREECGGVCQEKYEGILGKTFGLFLRQHDIHPPRMTQNSDGYRAS